MGGAVFLHIPKTGGTWVCKILEEMGLVRRAVGRHPHTAYERATIFPNGKRKWKEWTRPENWKPENWMRPGVHMKMPYTFCFVRHPVRWYESWWRYLMGKQDIPWLENAINADGYLKRWGPMSVPCQAFVPDFNEFMKKMQQRFPGYVTWLYGNYAVPEVNFVGKQERLAADLVYVLKDLGLTFDEARVRERPHVNKAKLEEGVQWDEGLLREVQAAEQTAMTRYGYAVLNGHDQHENELCLAK